MLTTEHLLNSYKPFDKLEHRDLEAFRQFVSKYGNRIYNRAPNQPTITASAIVVNPEFTKILVMHHKLHGFYKQFGGHADGNPNLSKVATEELAEESGAMGNLLIKTPFDLIRWNFPDMTKKGVFYPAHDCFDIAFLFQMNENQELKLNRKEVLDTKWQDLKTWRDYSDMANPVYASNPQNLNYQRRVYSKIELMSKTL